jgi:5-methylcytosine-specific restriction endonuclease McrA
MKRTPLQRRAPLRRTGFGKRGEGRNGTRPWGKPLKRRRVPTWREGRRKVQREGCCRRCGTIYPPLDPHHIIHCSLSGDQDEENCCPLCRSCHRAVHEREFDLWFYLSSAERAHAIALLGEFRAKELLIPSRSSKRVGGGS